jgi:hypothetical protein
MPPSNFRPFGEGAKNGCTLKGACAPQIEEAVTAGFALSSRE